MGANTAVRPASTLAANLSASGTAITVVEAGSGGLAYAQGEDVRIYNEASGVDFVMNDNDNDASVVGETISPLSAATAAAAIGSYAINQDQALTENADYIMDYTGGQIRFLAGGAANTGDVYAVVADRRRAANTRVNLGAFLPEMEMRVRLVHRFPDGRVLTLRVPRAKITPENPNLEFSGDDWIGLEMQIAVLASEDPQDARAPLGYYEMDYSAQTLQPVTGSDSLTIGTFQVYVTPLSSVAAAARGFTTEEFSLGCIRVGNVEVQNEIIRHYCGTPRVKDKELKIQTDMTINATVDHVTSKNLALLFEGELQEDPSTATYAEFVALVTVPDLSTPEGEAEWVKLPYILIDPN